MSTPNGSTPTTASEVAADPNNPTIADAERAVEQNREQLASTVDALQAKLDVKSNAQAKLNEVKDRATTADGKPRPEVLGGSAAFVLLLILLIWGRRRD